MTWFNTFFKINYNCFDFDCQVLDGPIDTESRQYAITTGQVGQHQSQFEYQPGYQTFTDYPPFYASVHSQYPPVYT